MMRVPLYQSQPSPEELAQREAVLKEAETNRWIRETGIKICEPARWAEMVRRSREDEEIKARGAEARDSIQAAIDNGSMMFVSSWIKGWAPQSAADYLKSEYARKIAEERKVA